MNEQNSVAIQNKRDIRTFIQSDVVKNQLAMVLPKHITPDRMARVCLTAIMRTPKLMSCSQESLLQALMLCSQMGLEPDSRNAHLIPYGDRVQVIFDYKGLITLSRRNGVRGIHSDVVCENDVFEVTFDGGPKLTHRIDYKRSRGGVYAVYCYFILDEEPDVEVMQREEIEAIRKRSQAGQSGPWVTDWNEMAKKTVIRRASKKWPLDPEVSDAIMAEEGMPGTVGMLPAKEIQMFAQLEKPITPGVNEPGPKSESPVVDSKVSDIVQCNVSGEPAKRGRGRPPKVAPDLQPEIMRPTPDVRPEPVPEPDTVDGTSGSVELSPVGKLQEYLIEREVSFDQFQDWLRVTGRYPEADSIGNLSEVPNAVAASLLADKPALEKLVRIFGKY